MDVNQLGSLPLERGVASYGELKLFEGHRVIWPDGTSVEMEIRAAYSETPFCFPSGVGGIRLGDDDRSVARFLAVYMRSSLAKYWLILTGYTAQTERSRVTLDDVKSLPFLSPDRHPNPELARHLVEAADEIVARFETPEGIMFPESVSDFSGPDIDRIVFDYFGLTENERIVVLDMVNLVAPSLQPTSYAEIMTPLSVPPQAEDRQHYLRRLEYSLKAFSEARRGRGTIRAKLANQGKSVTRLAVVHISLSEAPNAPDQVAPHGTSVRHLLEAIEDRVADGSPVNFFSLPNSIFVWGNDIYVVKPQRMRFWSQSAALRDADEVFQLLAQFTPSSWDRNAPAAERSNSNRTSRH